MSNSPFFVCLRSIQREFFILNPSFTAHFYCPANNLANERGNVVSTRWKPALLRWKFIFRWWKSTLLRSESTFLWWKFILSWSGFVFMRWKSALLWSKFISQWWKPILFRSKFIYSGWNPVQEGNEPLEGWSFSLFYWCHARPGIKARPANGGSVRIPLEKPPGAWIWKAIEVPKARE